MPKSSVPSLINGSTGKPELASCGKSCPCRGCEIDLPKGARCFDVPNPRTKFASSRRFCPACFQLILEKTRRDIDVLARL
jgi:hypothetical protein